MTDPNRRWIRRRAPVCGAFFLLLLLATPAAALPVTAYFSESSGMGVSESDALAISSSYGVPILDPSFVGDAEGVLDVLSQDLIHDSVYPSPPIAPSGNQSTSVWIVQNESSFDLIGNTYYLFTTVDPLQVDDMTVMYEPANVGLTIDADLGWVFVRAIDDSGNRFYYAAMSLGPLSPDEIADPFAVNYVVDEPLVRSSAGIYVLPQLRGGMAYAETPEPGTALMMALGLGLLAYGSRRRD